MAIVSSRQWQACLDDLRRSAHAAGLAATEFDRFAGGLAPDRAVIARAGDQPEHTESVGSYVDKLVSRERIAAGCELGVRHGALLAGISDRYGVPAGILLAIWGIESRFGRHMGDFGVLRSLATLAALGGRRHDFWREQFVAALAIAAHGHAGNGGLRGSWAGAMGHVQFMPTTFRDHAVDFDADGRRDIWASVADALASAANYLQKSGWQRSAPWGGEVRLPAAFDFAGLADDGHRPWLDWQAAGISVAGGAIGPPDHEDLSFRLLLPAGARGPAFLVTTNFDAVLTYNAAIPYALAVGHLADRCAGGPPLSTPWPPEPPLSRDERKSVQTGLNARGFDTGGIDGIMGRASRVAIRRYQLAHGLVADGFADRSLLDHLSGTC